MKYRFKNIPKQERPRERVISQGASSLNNIELIAIVIGTGSKKEDVLSLSSRILRKYNLDELSNVTVSELRKIFGINDAKACKIVATIELGKRIISYSDRTKKITSPQEIVSLLLPKMKNLKKEILKAIYLDSKAKIIKQETISIGGTNINSVEPKHIFNPAIRHSASFIILVHNHPSGDPTPSKPDVMLTRQIKKSGKLLGIRLLDHIIIGNKNYISFREENLLKNI